MVWLRYPIGLHRTAGAAKYIGTAVTAVKAPTKKVVRWESSDDEAESQPPVKSRRIGGSGL